jgi:archaellum biogenesis protein FlaJ (TadC family)
MPSKKEAPLSFEEKLYRMFLPFTRNISSDDFEEALSQADITVDIDLYFSKNIFFALFILVIILFFGSLVGYFMPDLISFKLVIILALSIFILFIGYSVFNPYMIIGNKVTSIKNALPLAIIGMSSVAESGAPPVAIFSTKTVRDKSQYLDKELSKIEYYVNNLGISLLEAIDISARKTPSYELKKFLLDLKSNIEAGGSLPEFMKKKAENARFQYNLLLNNQNQKAETFGDIYSAIVVAGPLFLFSGIMLLGMVGGGVAGLSINTVLQIGIFLLVPIINISFIAVLNLVSG